jgi:hypothetical protein
MPEEIDPCALGAIGLAKPLDRFGPNAVLPDVDVRVAPVVASSSAPLD